MRPAPLAFDAIGTRWEITIFDDLSDEKLRQVIAVIGERIDRFDKDYSRFRADSLVTAMSKKAGSYSLPEDAEPMLSLYKKMYDATDGAVTPLIGQVLVDAGYDATYSLKNNPLHTPPAWDDVLTVGPGTLTLKTPALLDFGAAGKGYLIDIIGKVLEHEGVGSFCINAGGDVLHRRRDGAPLAVGLEHPDDPKQVIGVAELGNESICGSAGNRRAWGDFHHIINPHTLLSPRHLAAVWAVADTTLVADGMATCLYFVPPERLSAWEFEYLLLFRDHSIQKSAGFNAELFTS